MDKFRSWMSEAESRISQVEDTVHKDSRELRILQKQVQFLHEKTVNMENGFCRRNLWVVGLPKRVEGAKPAEFAEGFLATLLGLMDLPPTFVVERAHRVPTTPSIPGAPPRPFLIKLLTVTGIDCWLATRNAAELSFENSKISLYPDYSPEVQQRRRSSGDPQAPLGENSQNYSLLCPRKLRVVDGSSTHYFETEAVSWLDAC